MSEPAPGSAPLDDDTVTALASIDFPKLTRSTLNACRFSSWFTGPLRKVSVRGLVHKLDEDEERAFRAWFDEDGVRLPSGVGEPGDSQLSDSDDSDSEDAGSSSVDDAASLDSEKSVRHSFPRLTETIDNAIAAHGALFPKLNRTAPQDAQWILPLPQPMKCTSTEDVYLAIKASGLLVGVMEGLEETLEIEEDVPGADKEASRQSSGLEIVLKKWYDMERGREFRVFVRDNVVVGICQRDTNHYPHLLDLEIQAKIRETAVSFHNTKLRPYLPLSSYVFDLYYHTSLLSAHLVDLAPFHPLLAPGLLFTYPELAELVHQHAPPVFFPSEPELEVISSIASSPLPELRVIEDRANPIASGNAPKWPAYPVDVDMAVSGAGIGNDGEEEGDTSLEGIRKRWEVEIERAVREDNQKEKEVQEQKQPQAEVGEVIAGVEKLGLAAD